MFPYHHRHRGVIPHFVVHTLCTLLCILTQREI